MSFVWGDQVERKERLREGIDAYRHCQKSVAPAQVYRRDLSNDLEDFLEGHIPSQFSAPVVIYNTYVTSYPGDKGGSLAYEIGRWASRQNNPVLWLQWELDRDGQSLPDEGWIAWPPSSGRGACTIVSV